MFISVSDPNFVDITESGGLYVHKVLRVFTVVRVEGLNETASNLGGLASLLYKIHKPRSERYLTSLQSQFRFKNSRTFTIYNLKATTS